MGANEVFMKGLLNFREFDADKKGVGIQRFVKPGAVLYGFSSNKLPVG
jgi:hypothetical protein